MVTYSDLVVQSSPAVAERDAFASDGDGSLEMPVAMSMFAGDGGLQAESERVQMREHRLTEYLHTGANGNAFSDNPSVALAGEDRGWHNSQMRGAFSDLFHRKRMLDYMWWLFQVGDPVARNIVNTYTFFIVGSGPEVTFSSGDEQLDEKRKERWKRLSKTIKWGKKVRQLIKGAVLFGETFALTTPRKGPRLEVDGEQVRAIAERAGGAAAPPNLHVLNAGDIERILHTPGNPENVIAYAQRGADGKLMGNHPDDIVHFTLDTLPNSLRGSPLLLPVLQHLYYYRAWLTNRHWLNMVRARVPLIMRRKMGGTQAVKAVAAKYGKLPPPGTVWVLPGTLEADFPNLNVNAPDARDDGKQILRTIAMGVQLPEFLVTADASNANYSSSVVAESPAMRMFADLQDQQEPQLAEVVARLMDVPVEHVSVAFPPVERNVGDRAKGYHLGYTDGVLSAQTYVEKAYNLPWHGADGERARLEAEGVVFDENGRPTATPTAVPLDSPPEPGTGRATPPGQAAA